MKWRKSSCNLPCFTAWNDTDCVSIWCKLQRVSMLFQGTFATILITFWLSLHCNSAKISNNLNRESNGVKIYWWCKMNCKYKSSVLTHTLICIITRDYLKQKKCLTGRLQPARHVIMIAIMNFISILWKCNHFDFRLSSRRVSRQLSSPFSWQ